MSARSFVTKSPQRLFGTGSKYRRLSPKDVTVEKCYAFNLFIMIDDLTYEILFRSGHKFADRDTGDGSGSHNEKNLAIYNGVRGCS